MARAFQDTREKRSQGDDSPWYVEWRDDNGIRRSLKVGPRGDAERIAKELTLANRLRRADALLSLDKQYPSWQVRSLTRTEPRGRHFECHLLLLDKAHSKEATLSYDHNRWVVWMHNLGEDRGDRDVFWSVLALSEFLDINPVFLEAVYQSGLALKEIPDAERMKHPRPEARRRSSVCLGTRDKFAAELFHLQRELENAAATAVCK
jgi:hypothetical protein